MTRCFSDGDLLTAGATSTDILVASIVIRLKKTHTAVIRTRRSSLAAEVHVINVLKGFVEQGVDVRLIVVMQPGRSK